MLAFTFPGQGSQRPGMGRAWVDHPSWELVSDASVASGRDVEHLLLAADTEELTATRNAQLATFTLSLVVLDAVERLGLEPGACAGHSLGEYTALVASGALGFEDGVRLVSERGDAMQAAADSRPGTMAALLGIDDDDAGAACQRAEGEAWVANFNAPGQVVVAGTAEAVEATSAVAKALGARKTMPISVGGAFHTPLMAPARERLRKSLAATTFYAPEIPVIANVDARPHVRADEWKGLLSAQLCSPVRWRQTLRALHDMGATALVEVGPGGVLTGLARRVVPDAQGVAVGTPDDLDSLVATLAGESSLHAYAAAHQGEHLYVSERLVLSPAAGLFDPAPSFSGPDPRAATPTARAGEGARHGDDGQPVEGREVGVGEFIGTVGDTEVLSPFAGRLMGLLAIVGERVVNGQPVAWVRYAGEDR